MKEEKGTKDAFQRDEDFLELVAQEAGSDRYQESLRNVEQGVHPTDEMLYEYVWGGLDGQEARTIRAHIAFCSICAEEVLRLRLVEDQLEERWSNWANGEEAFITPPFPPSRGESPSPSQKRVLSKGDLLEGLATELWEPQWMGQLATAADIPGQKHVFRREDGDITISCFWRGNYRKKPAYISISWKADVTTRNEMRARFVNPETREQLAEVYLGTCLVGEKVFTSDDLGFDPSRERWAMALIVKEVEEA